MRKTSKRVILNRAVFDGLLVGVADGLLAVADEIIAVARPPDAEPFGKGLVTTGATVGFVNGRKIGGTASKPRSVRLAKGGVAALAGFGFPGHFQELGTINHAPQPFLTPAMNQVIPNATEHIKPKVQAALARVR